VDEFFEPPPRSKIVFGVLPPHEWDGPPRDAVPAIVPIERVVAQADDVGVYLACLRVYPTGFEFETSVVAKDEAVELDPFSFQHWNEAEKTGVIPPGQLRLGFLFADGAKVTNIGGELEWDREPGSRPKGPVMRSPESGGGGGDWYCRLWVWPIPQPGSLQFVCEWPGAGIPLTYTDLDSAAIIDAASRSKALFPGS
jgi:hypothetical protein